MPRAIRRLAAPLALAAALAAPAAASAQVSASAAAEAREQGFDAREALGPDVSLEQSGPAEGLFRVELANGQSVTTHGPDTTAAAGEHGTSIGPGDPERPPACATLQTLSTSSTPHRPTRRAATRRSSPRSEPSCGA